MSLALIWGLMRSRSSTFCRWMGANSDPRPPSPNRLVGTVVPVVVPVGVVVVPVVVEVPSRPPRLGENPAWKGTFWPTVISPSVLSTMVTCGVLITFTSLEVCRALSTTANEGSVSPIPGTVMGGPWRPARKPLSEASPATPASELSPPSSLPKTSGAGPLALRKFTLSITVPACAETPSLVWSWRLTSMITASTSTSRRGTSSFSITFVRLR